MNAALIRMRLLIARHGFVRACAATMALASANAWAGPPFVTDDPEPVEARAWEINSAVTGQRAQDGTAALLPVIDINYGLVSGVQLHLQPQGAYVKTNAASAGAASSDTNEPEVDLKNRLPQQGEGGSEHTHAYGLGDTEIGVKWRLTPESENSEDWMVSVYPLAEIPTGDAKHNLGAGAASFYLPVWFQRSFGKITTFGGGGYWINHGTGSRNSWAGGWAALYQFTENLQLGGKFLARRPMLSDKAGSPGSAWAVTTAFPRTTPCSFPRAAAWAEPWPMIWPRHIWASA